MLLLLSSANGLVVSGYKQVTATFVAAWLNGKLVLINVVALRRARLVLGWVTVSWYLTKANKAYSAWPSLHG